LATKRVGQAFFSKTLCQEETLHGNAEPKLNRSAKDKRTNAKEVISLWHLNIQSLSSKVLILDAYLTSVDRQPDILILTEHWLTEAALPASTIDGYKIASYTCRQSLKHGGVAILTGVSMQYEVVSLSALNSLTNEGHCELSAILLKKLNLIIVGVYRPPKGDFLVFLNTLEAVLSHKLVQKKKLAFAGDFNVNFLNLACPKLAQLTPMLNSYGLKAIIFEPTRLQNCLDNILINFSMDEVENLGVLNFCHSDHSVIKADLRVCRTAGLVTRRLTRPLSSEKLLCLKHLINTCDWSFVFNADIAIDERWNLFISHLSYFIDESLPKVWCTMKSRSERKLWITKDLMEQSKWIQVVHDLHKHSQDANLLQLKRKLRSQYRQKLAEAKIGCNEKYINSASNKQKAMLEVVNKKRPAAHSSTDLPLSSDELNSFLVSLKTVGFCKKE